MNTWKFEATVENGQITVPGDCDLLTGTRVRVKLQMEPQVADKGDLISELIANPLPLMGFVPLSREEAHAR